MKKTLLAAMLGLGIVAGTAAPAQAIPNDCSMGTICFWENGTSPYGKIAEYPGTIGRNLCQHIFWETGITLMDNRTSTRWFLFRDSTCSGAKLEAPPGYYGQVQALPGGSGWDNDVVAVFRTSYTY